LSDLSTPAPPAGSARKWRWLLLISVALNLVFVGGLAALWWKGPPGPWRGGASQTAFGLMKFSRELPDERRDAVRRHLKEARPVLKAAQVELRQARAKAAEVLGSASYTPEAMRAALDAVAATDNRLRSMGTDALMKAIGELTADDRQKLAASWTRRLEREQRRKGKRDRDDGASDSAADGP
jgi:uncharacterized membrane protein